MIQLAILNAYVSTKAMKFYGTALYLELVLPEVSSLVWTQKVNMAFSKVMLEACIFFGDYM